MSERGPQSSPGFWLHHAALTWRQACEARLGDITYPQFNILAAVSLLNDQGTPPTQQEAADSARIDRKMASKLVLTLTERNLLTRAADHSDARLRRLHVTQAGRDAVGRCVQAARQADQEVFGPDSDGIREALRMIAERRLPFALHHCAPESP